MRNRFYSTMAAMAGLAALLPQAHPGERVTLRNGFEMQCTHHAAVEDRVRLFSGDGDDSYIELRQNEIASVEQVPDPPKLPAAQPDTTAPTPQTLAAGRGNTDNTADAGLSPEDLREMLAKAGREHNVDVDLLASLVKAESGGNARAVSRTGARGLMQLMPATAAELGVEDSFQPEQNVRGGTAYLDELLTSYHDNLALALAAYNAGPGAVAKYHGIPPYAETRAYVARVIHEFNRRIRARQAPARLAAALPAAPEVQVSSR
jgi:soluble lytic murein transglycosylase-like protein